jgi:hypothetical protein
MICDNRKPVVPPTCVGRQASHLLTVIYNDIEKDVLHVCAECGQRIATDARGHGYRTTMRKLDR